MGLQAVRRPQLDLEDLQTFIEVADAAGVSAAARRLGVSKSIVSRRLFRLEEVLGTQLLARTTRGAALTEAGVTLREHASSLCNGFDVALEAIMPTGELRGRLRITAPYSLGLTHLAPVLTELAQRHPLLHVHADYSDRFVDIVSEGFDCAVRCGHLRDSNLVARKIGPIYGKLVASPEYVEKHGSPETPDELLSHEALMQGTEAWHLLEGDRVIAVRPQGRFKADSAAALAVAAAGGLGIARLPDFLIDAFPDGALVPVLTRFPVAPGGIYVVRPPGHQPPRKVRALTELLLARFGNAPIPAVHTLPTLA